MAEIYNLGTPHYYVVAVTKQRDNSSELIYLKRKNTCHTGVRLERLNKSTRLVEYFDTMVFLQLTSYHRPCKRILYNTSFFQGWSRCRLDNTDGMVDIK